MELYTYINRFPQTEKLVVNDLNKDITEYLENHRHLDNSIFGFYNEKDNELYVIRSIDEIRLVSKVSNFIKNYHGDLSDLHLYAIVISSYARLASRLIDLECRILKRKTSQDKRIGLIKKI